MNPPEFVGILPDLRQAGIERFTLDRCPRCDLFVATASASVTTTDDAIACWAVSKATERARLGLYLSHARTLARAGQLPVARDLAQETVAHASLEDPEAHLLLGQIAAALGDRTLLREAKAHLRFLQLDSWARRLDQALQSGSHDFEPVG